jgi:hypothetical protein
LPFSQQAILKTKRLFIQETRDRHLDRPFDRAFR